MPRPRSAQSVGSDGELEGLAEQELVKLQRQYRIMEGDRAAYTEESQNIIRKQKYAIIFRQLVKDTKFYPATISIFDLITRCCIYGS